MGQVIQRTWKSGPRSGRRTAWGYTLQVNGRQVRKFDQTWNREEAETQLALALGERDKPRPRLGAVLTMGQAVERYLKAKARKRSLKDDARHLTAFMTRFGAGIPLTEITAAGISEWKDERLAATCKATGEPYSAAAINRPLAALRHLLQLAHEEWEALPSVPRIRLEKEPEGRIRWLEPDEEARLLAACSESRNPQLRGLVTVALETGLRRGELLGLTWDRVDLSRGVLRLEFTKSGRRREVPMRQAVYDVLAAMPGERAGRVWRARSIRTAFENAVDAAGLGDFHFHDCRHHFASWFMMRGGSLQALKEILGHRQVKMTERYTHLAPHYLRQEVARTERRPGTVSTTSAQEAGAEVDSERTARVTP